MANIYESIQPLLSISKYVSVGNFHVQQNGLTRVNIWNMGVFSANFKLKNN
jgi:hypothetical protein